MKKRSGLYPRVQVDAAGSGVVSQAGVVVLLETAQVTGLDRQLWTALDPWRRQGARHDPRKVVLDLAVALVVGGDCLADIAVRPALDVRDEPEASNGMDWDDQFLLAPSASRPKYTLNSAEPLEPPRVPR